MQCGGTAGVQCSQQQRAFYLRGRNWYGVFDAVQRTTANCERRKVVVDLRAHQAQRISEALHGAALQARRATQCGAQRLAGNGAQH